MFSRLAGLLGRREGACPVSVRASSSCGGLGVEGRASCATRPESHDRVRHLSQPVWSIVPETSVRIGCSESRQDFRNCSTAETLGEFRHDTNSLGDTNRTQAGRETVI
jgi:hypothetical protein